MEDQFDKQQIIPVFASDNQILLQNTDHQKLPLEDADTQYSKTLSYNNPTQSEKKLKQNELVNCATSQRQQKEHGQKRKGKKKATERAEQQNTKLSFQLKSTELRNKQKKIQKSQDTSGDCLELSPTLKKQVQSVCINLRQGFESKKALNKIEDIYYQKSKDAASSIDIKKNQIERIKSKFRSCERHIYNQLLNNKILSATKENLEGNSQMIDDLREKITS